ncbi:MAG: HlyC/CorC family transporter [Bacilli bacterium]|nr:HlyC/CorC family transporter [Bacilli bacterium]
MEDPSVLNNLFVASISAVNYALFFILLLLSAFFSASETAFSSVSVVRLKSANEEGKRGSKIALYIVENFDKTLSAILIGNNIVNIASTALVTSIAIEQLGEVRGPIVATIVSTIVILLFGEIFPKSFAKENAFTFTIRFGWLLLFFMRIFAPLIFLVTKLKNLISKAIKKDKDTLPSVTEDELGVIIDTMTEEGVIEQEEQQMIHSVLDLRDTNVYDIMTPRVDMVGVYLDDDIDYIKELFLKEKFSRMPVYKETKDNVVGILYERDFFEALITTEDKNTIKVEELMRKPLFVPKTMRVDALMSLLQKNKQHLAIVSDEYGGTSGLVTMEDCLEELVGEIYDEHDEEEFEIRKIDEENYDINADIALDDLFEELKLGKAPETQYNSLGGWLYEQLEEIPEIGDQYTYTSLVKVDRDITTIEDDEYIEYKLCFTVKELNERRMKTIHLNIMKHELTGKEKAHEVVETEETKE